VKYELGFYIPGDGILHSHCRENLKTYTWIPRFGWTFKRRNIRKIFIPNKFIYDAVTGLA
jgi:hypothetical protein